KAVIRKGTYFDDGWTRNEQIIRNGFRPVRAAGKLWLRNHVSNPRDCPDNCEFRLSCESGLRVAALKANRQVLELVRREASGELHQHRTKASSREDRHGFNSAR